MTLGRAWQQGRAASHQGALVARNGRLRGLLVSAAAVLACAPVIATLAPTPAGAGACDMTMVAVAAAPQVPLGARALGAAIG